MSNAHPSRPAATAVGAAPYTRPAEPMPPMVVAVIDAEAPAVLATAHALLGDAHREVIVLSVAWPFTTRITIGESTVFPTEYKEGLVDELSEVLRREIAAVAPGDTRWHARVELGEPEHVITRVARDAQASLIVLGIGRHHVSDRLLGTETALRVIQHAHCPVLAVASGLHARPRTVVVATDFSADCMRAVTSALPLLAPDTSLYFVHVWEPDYGDSERAKQRDEEYRAGLPERFAHMIAWLQLPPEITVHCEVREGRPAGRVLDFAASHGAELVVAGRHGLGKLGRLLIGSVTSVLVRGSHCSLLIAPEEPRPIS